MPDVTLATVAREAGVHRSTVSLALRDHPRIPAETRARVRRIAESLGYRPNPMVVALMRLKRAAHPTAKHTTLAYLTAFPTRSGWKKMVPDYFPGAETRSRELGFRLEDFWLTEPGMKPDRLARILHARGIRGVLIGRTPPGVQELKFPWEQFATVSVGVSLAVPVTHIVAHQQFHDALLAFDRCRELGYRRIGLAVLHSHYPRAQERWIGAFLSRQQGLSRTERVPFLLQQSAAPGRLVQWIEEKRVDVILTGELARAREELATARIRVPGEVALAALGRPERDPATAGIYHNPARVGTVAIDVLTAQIYRNEMGLPADPQEILLDGHWLDGASAPGR